MLLSLLQTPLQTIINHYLALSPEIEKKLAPLSGKILAIHIKKLNINYGFLFTKKNIEVITESNITADATISGEPWLFIKLMRTASIDNLSKLIISGDHSFCEAAYSLVHCLDIDWEEIISHYTGDVIAHNIGRGARSIKKWLTTGVHSFQHSLTEYLQEELHYLPSAAEVDDFMAAVDEIALSIDRLEARLTPFL